jgi:hypothetical protein
LVCCTKKNLATLLLLYVRTSPGFDPMNVRSSSPPGACPGTWWCLRGPTQWRVGGTTHTPTPHTPSTPTAVTRWWRGRTVKRFLCRGPTW